jgi:hypothetical protein
VDWTRTCWKLDTVFCCQELLHLASRTGIQGCKPWQVWNQMVYHQVSLQCTLECIHRNLSNMSNIVQMQRNFFDFWQSRNTFI